MERHYAPTNMPLQRSSPTHIISTPFASTIHHICSTYTTPAILLIDVDDTIITPQSKTFHHPPYNNLINEIKSDPQRFPNYQAIVSAWRQQRSTRLVDPAWPTIINHLATQHRVYALTSMDHGAYGSLPSMERWRYEELLSHGITFCHNHQPPIKASHPRSLLYQGIILTGQTSKSNAIAEQLHQEVSCSSIIAVDNELHHLIDMQAWCLANHIDYLGIHFTGMARFLEPQHPDIFELQKKYLLNHLTWLEDDAAADHLGLRPDNKKNP